MDKFTIATMDWVTPQEVHAFQAKTQSPFGGPLSNKTEGQKVRLLLLWASNKGLEMYNIHVAMLSQYLKCLRHTQSHRAIKY